MVAQFLGLKLRLLGNLFRRSPWQVVGIVIGLLYGLGVAFLVTAGLVALRFTEVELARGVVVVAGSAIVLGFLLVPLVFGVDDTLDPRRFSLFGMPNSRLAGGLAVAALLGVPSLAITIIAFAQIATWSRGALPALLAVVTALLVVVTCVLGARVTTSFAALLLATRRARETSGLIALLLFVGISPVIALLTAVDWRSEGLVVLERVAQIAGWTPLGAVWSVPADAAAGRTGESLAKLAIALVFAALLWAAWRALVATMLIAPERESRARAYTGLGWFARTPDTPAGAIAARSLSYWGRDVRYRSALVVVPLVPLLMMGALSVGGVPFTSLVLLPVPIMCFFLAWSTVHNDVAFDNTAIWLHVAAGTRGRDDRIGRVIPALGLGLLVIAVGAPLATMIHGGGMVLMPVIGLSLCVLLSGLGLSSVMSARFPYPAVHPGDSPFAQPQSSATAASWIQALSIFVLVAVSAPTILFVVLATVFGGAWHLVALLVGAATGIVALLGGISWGGRIFEARAPELLAFTLRY